MMTEPSKKKLDHQPGGSSIQHRDNPEQLPTEKESLMDGDPSQMNVDSIPVEDQTIEQQDEKDKTKTKNDSSSARKYHTGF
ncbi:hypothetical protein SAMN05880570_0012 [Paenibacillus sp. RU4T]|nr:hypothetical protein SAMN05880555_0012 [Paenibacillus sp. RU4X]SIQ11725.1 hypothetical protein SAMN05880570_0012 [Paenibacillus sp. RU4T]